MKLFKLSKSNNIQYAAQLVEEGNCNCTGTNCIWQCLPDPVVPVWMLISPACGCTDCIPPDDQCDENKFNHILTPPCLAFDMVERTCSKGVDENGCVIFGTCGDPDCISSCTVETPCLDENPCCQAFLFCDSDPSSSTCGQCVTEQGGDPSDCFNCPECSSSLCNPPDPPGPPSPPSPPGPEPPCKKYVTGALELRDGIWTCVDKITRQEIPAECCDLPPPEPPIDDPPDPPFTPTITVTNTTGPTSTPTTIGPTPTPEVKDPCVDITMLESVVNNIVLFEQLCNCKCYAKYTCFNGVCVQDPNGSHDSYMSCLNYLCGGGDCGNSLPEPTPLPEYSVCQDPLIINQ